MRKIITLLAALSLPSAFTQAQTHEDLAAGFVEAPALWEDVAWSLGETCTFLTRSQCKELWRRQFDTELENLATLQQRFQELLTMLPPEKLGKLTEVYIREKLNNFGLVQRDPVETARFHLTLGKALLGSATKRNLEWVPRYLSFIETLLSKFPAQHSEYRP